jgi:RNA polymerase sigma-70 factor, ECF subfamily
VKSDADLVREALRGVREPLGELLRRHWDTAVFLTAQVLGSPELARDAAQEAAIAAMTDLHRLRTPDRFGAWFCGIALNVSRRWLRQLRSEVPSWRLEQASPSPGPAEAAEIADLAARVRAAVAALPDGQRDAVLLFYMQGLSHREVAEPLGWWCGGCAGPAPYPCVSLWRCTAKNMYGVTLIMMVPASRGLLSPRARQPGRGGDLASSPQ